MTCVNGPPASAAHCDSSDLTNANLTHANLSGAVLSANTSQGPDQPLRVGDRICQSERGRSQGADLSTGNGRANFGGANLAGANMVNGDFGAASFTNAKLTGASLTGAVMASVVEPFGVTVYATLTGATLTWHPPCPSNQSVTATSQAGAVVTWPTPAGIPGATPGSCTPASGSTFPLFSSTVACQVLDNNGDVATGDVPSERTAHDPVLHPSPCPL